MADRGVCGVRMPSRLVTGLLLTAFAIWSAREHGLERGTLFAFVIAMGNLGAAAYALASRLGTAYGVSSKRILIVSTVPRRRVVSLDLLTLGHLSVESHGDGSGTVVLEPARFGLVEGASLPAPDERAPAPRLHRIKDAQAVRDTDRGGPRAAGEGGIRTMSHQGRTEGPLAVQLPDGNPPQGRWPHKGGVAWAFERRFSARQRRSSRCQWQTALQRAEIAPAADRGAEGGGAEDVGPPWPGDLPRQRRAVEESLILEAPLTPEAIGRAEEAHRAVRRRSLSVPERFGPEQPLDVRFADYTLGEDGQVIPGSTGWTTAERRRFSRFLRRMLPIVRDLYGDPFERWTITVVKDLYYTGSWIFIPSLLEIHTDGSWNPRLLAHEFIHAFRGRRTLTNDANWNYTPTLSGFEEGFAEGVAYMAMNAYVAQYCAGGDCSGADVPSYYRWDSYLEGVYDFSRRTLRSPARASGATRGDAQVLRALPHGSRGGDAPGDGGLVFQPALQRGILRSDSRRRLVPPLQGGGRRDHRDPFTRPRGDAGPGLGRPPAHTRRSDPLRKARLDSQLHALHLDPSLPE